jgi:hypothetical protein
MVPAALNVCGFDMVLGGMFPVSGTGPSSAVAVCLVESVLFQTI